MIISENPAEYPGTSVSFILYFLKVEYDRTRITSENIETNLVDGIIQGVPIRSFYGNFSIAFSPIL
jgi:hypothetical protein